MLKVSFAMSVYQIASPACTELEVVMMDWLGKLLDLPQEFLASSGGKGGGVIQVGHCSFFSIPREVTYFSLANRELLVKPL